MTIKDKLNEIETMIEEACEDFRDDHGLCIYRIKLFWRETESGRAYPDCELVASTDEPHITPKPE